MRLKQRARFEVQWLWNFGLRYWAVLELRLPKPDGFEGESRSSRTRKLVKAVRPIFIMFPILLSLYVSSSFQDLGLRVGKIRGIDLPETNGTNSSNHSSNETVETIETVAAESSLAGTGVLRLGMPTA